MDEEFFKTLNDIRNTHIPCGDVCPMITVNTAEGLKNFSLYSRGVLTRREVEYTPDGESILGCIAMRQTGECLYSKD